MLIRKLSPRDSDLDFPLKSQLDRIRNHYLHDFPRPKLLDITFPVEDPGYGRLVIDKIALNIPLQNVNKAVADLLLNREPVHFIVFGKDYYQIVIHPDWMPEEPIHAYRVMYAMTQMGLLGAFSPRFHTFNRLITLMTGGRSPEDLAIIINYLKAHTVASDWETALDFYDFLPVETPDSLSFIHKGRTYYTRKDYKKTYRLSPPIRDLFRRGILQRELQKEDFKLKGTQYSAIKLYDWTSKHGGARQVFRLEFRFQGRYTKRIDLDWLGMNTASIFCAQLPVMKSLMWRLTLPSHFQFTGFARMRASWWFTLLLKETEWLNFRKERALVAKRSREEKNAGIVGAI